MMLFVCGPCPLFGTNLYCNPGRPGPSQRPRSLSLGKMPRLISGRSRGLCAAVPSPGLEALDGPRPNGVPGTKSPEWFSRLLGAGPHQCPGARGRAGSIRGGTRPRGASGRAPPAARRAGPRPADPEPACPHRATWAGVSAFAQTCRGSPEPRGSAAPPASRKDGAGLIRGPKTCRPTSMSHGRAANHSSEPEPTGRRRSVQDVRPLPPSQRVPGLPAPSPLCPGPRLRTPLGSPPASDSGPARFQPEGFQGGGGRSLGRSQGGGCAGEFSVQCPGPSAAAFPASSDAGRRGPAWSCPPEGPRCGFWWWERRPVSLEHHWR